MKELEAQSDLLTFIFSLCPSATTACSYSVLLLAALLSPLEMLHHDIATLLFPHLEEASQRFGSFDSELSITLNEALFYWGALLLSAQHICVFKSSSKRETSFSNI